MLRMLWQQTTAEFMKLWRVPMFSLSTILFPVFFFVIFGIPNAKEITANGTPAGQYILASLSAYGLLGIAFFSFGIGVANERGQGWMKLIKATPMPAWVYFVAKLVMALLFALIICLVMFPVAILGADVRMPLTQWLTLTASLLVGLLPFTTLGFTIGYWAGPNSAAPIAQFSYMLLAFASGMWIPLEQLPSFVQRIAPYLPTYHYAHVAWSAVGADDGKFMTHVVWLVGTAVVFGLLAVWGYHRDQGKQYG
jgi:ABC-2 type transport system permease protein